MQKPLFTFLIIVFCAYCCIAQNSKIDSLENLYKLENVDTLKFKLLSKIVVEEEKSNRSKAIASNRELLVLAEKINKPKQLGYATQVLGRNYLASDQNDSALYFLQLSNDYYLSINDSTQFIKNNSNIALVFQRTNRYEEAAIMYISVIDQSERKKDYYSAAAASINQASLLMNQDIYGPAIDYLKNIDGYLSIMDQRDEKKLKQVRDLLPNAYINLGLCFEEEKNRDSSIYYYNLAIDRCKELDNNYLATYISSYAHNSIGSLYRDEASELPASATNLTRRNIWLVASENFKKALEGFSSIDDKRGICFSKNELGFAQMNLGFDREAKKNIEDALAIAQEIDFIEEKQKGHNYLAKTYAKFGDYKSAYDNLLTHVEVKSKYLEEERQAQIQELDAKFQTAKKEQAIAQLAAENAESERQKQRQLTFFLIGIGSIISIGLLAWSRYRYVQQREKALYEQKVNTAMARFVPQEFIAAIGRDNVLDVLLGDSKEDEVSIIFTDIRNYTGRTENSSPAEIFNFVKEYAELIGPIIRKNNGFINQYLGDGIMAIFKQNPEDALLACIEMQKAVDKFNEELIKDGDEPIKVGMGLHTGPLIMGIIGDDTRRDATVISDTVNTAARMESMTKVFGADILISADAVTRLHNVDRFHLRSLGKVDLKGKNVKLEIFECFDTNELTTITKKIASEELFQEGITLYENREYAKALEKFEKVTTMNPDDSVTKQFMVLSRSVK